MNESRILVVSMRAKKHRIRIVAVSIIAAAMLFSCAQSEQDVQQCEVDSVGRVYIVGNDPVTQAVYRDNSGQYQIDNCYKNLSGWLIHVTGNITGDGMYGKMLDILSIEIIN
jgi:hypothetical protein